MSEKMFRYIKIGGTIGVVHIMDLLEAMYADGVIASAPSNDAPIQYKLGIIEDNMRGSWLWVEDSSSEDSFENLEEYCTEYGLPYDRHVVSEWSYSGNVRQHRPGCPDCVKITSSVTAEGMTQEDEEQIIHLLNEGDGAQAMKNYDKAVADTASVSLPPFRVV